MNEKFRYKKEMGQHFLLNPALVERLADASLVTKEDGVLEIGPGRGLLTAALARRARRVIAVELDRTLLPGLAVTLAAYPNAEVIQGDALRMDFAALLEGLGQPCRVAANLPYNITTPFLEKLLRGRLPFRTAALMVQREVGERMLASPGRPGYGPLSLLVAYYTGAEALFHVPAASFTPPPAVESSFLLLTPRTPPLAPAGDEAFFRLIRAAFSMRRKTMLNNLVAGYGLPREKAAQALEAAAISPASRAEEVDLLRFAGLAGVMKREGA